MSSEATNPRQALVDLIEAGQRAAEEFRHDEAIALLEAALRSPLLRDEPRAQVRCALAESLEYLARYREALAVIAEYENATARAQLRPGALFLVWLRLGSLQGYIGDHPRAISYLKSALALAEKSQDAEELGACHMVLGRIYRAIGEAQFARDHLRTALQFHRPLGKWSALAQNYFLLGNVYLNEGEMEAARENFEQAIKIIGERRAPLLLGSIYTNLSNLILLQEYRQATEGVEALEKAIYYLKEARNKRLLAYAYSNLGFVLTNIGEWERAQQMLHYAIEVGHEMDNRAVQGTALDTLGELAILQGRLDDAEELLERSLYHFQAANFPYGEVQALQTVGRCYLAQQQFTRAIGAFEQQLALAERIEDKRSRNSAQLYLAQTMVEMGKLADAQTLLDQLAEDIETSANISLVGHSRAVNGWLQQRAGHYEEARQEFAQARTIFTMVADRYRETTMRHSLSQVLVALGDEPRAREELRVAQVACHPLGQIPLRQQIEEALARLTGDEITPAPAAASRNSDAVILRLLRATASPELLLNELAAVLSDVIGCIPVIIYEEREGQYIPLAYSRSDAAEAESLRVSWNERLRTATSVLGTSLLEAPAKGAVYKLRGPRRRLVLLGGRRSNGHYSREKIEPLLRVAEMGLEIVQRRENGDVSAEHDFSNSGAQITSEGFVYASTPMRALLAEIHKIRGSRVTALITGESGTGKEVVARTIHNLSTRRSKPFAAFNCTVVAPEVVNSQLFGHKKGAFTGAVEDAVGVIEAAHGGTLFLDEIGDLSLDVQPKLLRFLQDGEIHRLGENTPIKVDVRVIAATNADLEKLVAEGRFREDLYYRLNIIRLHLPPLRDRREEIPLLIEHFLKVYSQQSLKDGITITPLAMDLLTVYDWPGNVRQLVNELQRLLAYKDSGETITERDLSPMIAGQHRPPVLERKALAAAADALLQSPTVASLVALPPHHQGNHAALSPNADQSVQIRYQPGIRSLHDIVDEVETQLILDAMRRHDGHRTAVCEELGITRKGLYLKLHRLGIDVSEFE
ncbi:MAG: sigma 54-interacting transcriptional regulator [Blastocatellia bacterium]